MRIGAAAVAQGGAGLDQGAAFGHFARQVAVGADLLAGDGGQHRPAAETRDIGRPLGAERPHQ